MTIAAAIKKRGRVFIGTDSFWGNHEIQELGSDDYSKMIVMDGFIVAIAGVANLRDVVEEIKESQETKISMQTKKDARNFTKEVLKRSKQMFEEGNHTPNAQDEGFAGGSIIIATPTTIFGVQNDLSVFIHDRYLAIGAGYAYAAAVLEFAYPGNSSGRMILQGALETACRLSPFCSGPLDVREVK